MELMLDAPTEFILSKDVRGRSNGTQNGQNRRKTDGRKDQPPIETYDYYLSVHIDAEGRPEIRSSASLKLYKDAFMRDTAGKLADLYQQLTADGLQNEERIRDSLEPPRHDFKVPEWNPHIPIPPPPSFGRDPVNSKRRRVESQVSDDPEAMVGSHPPSQCIQLNLIPSHVELAATSLSNTSAELRPKIAIPVADADAWHRWFSNAFRAIQQQACRYIAKEWIKLIHPKKQSTHPYNGNFPRNQRASPDRTRPPYWPHNVRHKEPDHIDKEARTILLVHLLMHTPQKEVTPASLEGNADGKVKEIFAEDLRQTLTKKQEEYKDKWSIIEEVISVRKQIENYEAQGCDDEYTIYVTDFQDNSRPAPSNKKQRTRSTGRRKDSMIDTIASGDESRMASPTPPATPTDPIDNLADSSDNGNDEDMAAMSLSFSSTITQGSSKAIKPLLRPKPETTYMNHLVPGSGSPHTTLINQSEGQNLVQFQQHGHVQHQPQVPPDRWPMSSPLDSHPGGAYGQSHAHVHTHDHGIILPPGSLHTITSYGQVLFPHQTHGPVSHAIMPPMDFEQPPYLVYPNFEANQHFAMQHQYCEIFPQAHPPPGPAVPRP